MVQTFAMNVSGCGIFLSQKGRNYAHCDILVSLIRCLIEFQFQLDDWNISKFNWHFVHNFQMCIYASSHHVEV